MRTKLQALLVVTLSIFVVELGHTRPKGPKVATGAHGGTYYHIGKSLNNIPAFRKLIVNTTRGSVQNLQLVADGRVQLGLCQMDVLINKALKSKRMRKKVKIILPVYEEEVHIVTSKGVLGLSDLQKKRINIGASGSGTRETAKIILNELGFGKRDFYVNKSKPQLALEKIMLREIDAMFYVAGAPVEMYSSLTPLASKRVHLLSMDDGIYKRLQKRFPYQRRAIKGGTYPWQGAEVKTVSVSSVIIGKSNLSAARVKALVKGAFARQTALGKAHKKWSELNKETVKQYLSKYRQYFHGAAAEAIEQL